MNTQTKITALATTTLLIVGLAGPAKADTPSHASLDNAPTETGQLAAVKAEQTSVITFEKPAVTTTPAPVVVEPKPVYVASQTAPVEVKQTTPVPSAPAATQAAPAAPKVAPQAAAPAPAPAVAPTGSGKGAGLLASAYSQIGITQDCTAMVEHALASIGIISGDLAPAQFFRFGQVVSTPAPGDILISSGHVGIYAGNGMMISGGFNGSQTVLHPVSYVGAYSAVRVA